MGERLVRGVLVLCGLLAPPSLWLGGCVLAPLPPLPCPCAEGYHCVDGACVPGQPPDAGPDSCARVSFGERTYLHCTELVTWHVAQDDCARRGMRLMRIETPEENELGRGLATTQLWLGGTDIDVEGVWRWQDGSAFWSGGLMGMPVGGAFTFWDVEEPNDLGGEDCLAMRRGGQWLDEDCALADNAYVCEPL